LIEVRREKKKKLVQLSMNFARTRILAPLKEQLVGDGQTPRHLSFSIAVGACTGVFPVPGLTTAICLALVALFRLNVIVAQTINLALTPVELMLVIPFCSLGTLLFGNGDDSTNAQISASLIRELLFTDWRKLIDTMGRTLAGGMGAWALLSLVAVYPLALISTPIVARLQGKQQEKID
jgi:uncharacterized protein (DUF2062 family)